MVGIAALAATGAWFGAPSRAAAAAIGGDPYRLDIGYGAAAIALALVAIVVRLAEHCLRGRLATRPARDAGGVRAVAALAGTVLVTLLVASCGAPAPADVVPLLQQARDSGAVSPATTAGSVDDARVHRLAKQGELCIRQYTAVLSAYPDLAEGYSGRAECYLDPDRDPAGAVRDYTQAIALTREVPGLYLARAAAYRATANTEAAVADYQHAVSIPSAKEHEFLQAVDGLIAVHHDDEAQSLALEAVARFPRSGVARLTTAAVDVALDRDAAALVELGRAEALENYDTDLGDRARVLARSCHFHVLRHQYDLARAQCTAATRLTDSGWGAYDDLSVADLALGNVSAAVDDLDRAVGTFVGNLNADAQPAGIDGYGLAALLEVRGRAEIEAQRPAAARSDFAAATRALKSRDPNFEARLKSELASAT
jgi:tetratricopeptide (TPR) repeat protein